MRLPLLPAALAALAALALAGCSQDVPAAPAATGSSAPSLRGSITVDAAASLSTVFPELATGFEAEHPGTTVDFSFGGSSALAASIVAGAPVDVFAAASASTMQTVSDAGLTAAEPVVVARNALEIAVPAGNPGRVTGLADFADADRTIVLCAREVPCGAAAQQVLRAAGVVARPDGYEPDVTSVLTKVRTDEADAGLVYVTDVRAAGDEVEGIPFPEAAEAITDYPIAPLTASRNPGLAAAWVDHVRAHQADLQEAGFRAPR